MKDSEIEQRVLAGDRPEIPGAIAQMYLPDFEDLIKIIRDSWEQDQFKRPQFREIVDRISMMVTE